jgi:hypothetical protein
MLPSTLSHTWPLLDVRGGYIENEQEQYFKTLCERAANEQDSKKLVEVIQGINND